VLFLQERLLEVGICRTIHAYKVKAVMATKANRPDVTDNATLQEASRIPLFFLSSSPLLLESLSEVGVGGGGL
jgi:hypothetical protein